MHMYPSIHPPNRYIHLSTSSSDVFSSLQEITRAFQVLSNEGTVEELHIYPSIHPPNKHLPIYQHPLLVFSLPFRRSRAPSKCSVYICVYAYIHIYIPTHTCISIHPSIHRIDISIYQHPLLVFSLPFRRSRAPSKCSVYICVYAYIHIYIYTHTCISIHPSIHRIDISIYQPIDIDPSAVFF